MLTDAEYRRVMTNKAALQSRIDSVTEDGKGLAAQIKALKAQRAAWIDEMSLYTNHLSAAIQEYEDSHPSGGSG